MAGFNARLIEPHHSEDTQSFADQLDRESTQQRHREPTLALGPRGAPDPDRHRDIRPDNPPN
jgi:hypothetical protein